MSGFAFDSSFPSLVAPRWQTQSTQLQATAAELEGASTAGLPSSAAGAAQTFLDMWTQTARRASVTAGVYSDELLATGTTYANLDAEIARRMSAFGAGDR